MAMPKGLSILKIIAIVCTLAKLNNFCIAEKDGNYSTTNLHMMNDIEGYLPMEFNADHGTLFHQHLWMAVIILQVFQDLSGSNMSNNII